MTKFPEVEVEVLVEPELEEAEAEAAVDLLKVQSCKAEQQKSVILRWRRWRGRQRW